MTRQESVIKTKRMIREAKCGDDVAQAMREHWSRFKIKTPAKAEVLNDFNGELF